MIVAWWYYTQKFAENPKYYSQFWISGHNWIDIGSNRKPSETYAIYDGRIECEVHPIYWKQVKLYTDDHKMYRYAHLSEFIPSNTYVKKWDIIWMTWNTGNSKGIHLHISKYELDEAWRKLHTDNWYFWAIDCLDEIKNFTLEKKQSFHDKLMELSLNQIIVLYNKWIFINSNNKKVQVTKNNINKYL